MVDLVRPRFRLGQTVATPAALEAIQQAGQSPAEFLDRHVRGDWGNLSADDRALNDEAVQDGSRILSAYVTRAGEKIWVITEATDDRGHRSATTILLPDEY
ncbi:MAG: hypothetical protein GXY83_24090 [Rhodopirellula sp.]|nr:hypothetical protein [Rhodopirellula sp.]